MASMLFVRAKPDVDPEELGRRIDARRPRFLEVPGLIQKIHARDEASGDTCGMDFFESREALAACRESEPGRTIPAAHEATEVRPDLQEVPYSLKPGIARLQAWMTNPKPGEQAHCRIEATGLEATGHAGVTFPNPR